MKKDAQTFGKSCHLSLTSAAFLTYQHQQLHHLIMSEGAEEIPLAPTASAECSESPTSAAAVPDVTGPDLSPTPEAEPLLERRRSVNQQYHHHVVPTERCGALNIYVQGELDEARKDKDNKCVFLTVHDIGGDHRSFENFINNDAFEDIRSRTIFIHVDVPGQEPGAADIDDSIGFPTLQALGEDLVTVLDQLRLKYCIGVGDGAGANIIARFGMMHVTRCLGVILCNPTANTVSLMDNIKDKVMSKWKGGASAKGECRPNEKNMKLFASAYLNRTHISASLAKNLRCDALLVVGAKAANAKAAEEMYSQMDKTRSSILKVDDVGDVLEEAPIKLAQSILLFCKGLGWLTSVTLPGLDRRLSTDSQGRLGKQRSISMEEYDKPNIRRLSIGQTQQAPVLAAGGVKE